MRALNIENIRINGQDSTTFDIYEEENGVLAFQYSASIKGSFKRESTVLRKHNEQMFDEH